MPPNEESLEGTEVPAKKKRDVEQVAAVPQEAAALWLPASELVPWADNPRKNDGEPVAKVAESIKRFGFAAPILARAADKMVIAGHTRLKAAKSLGLDLVPVRLLDLSLADARLLALADNRLSEISRWDDETLLRLAKELAADDLSLAGFTDGEVLAFLDPVGLDDVAWTQIDEDAGDGSPRPKRFECPHCGKEIEV